MKKPSIFTIGHSTRPIDEFVELLRMNDVKEVVDVRSIPMSRHNPQFNADTLKQSLKQNGIRYKRLKKLGGLRHSKKDSINLGWRNVIQGIRRLYGDTGILRGLGSAYKDCELERNRYHVR
jgi:uncharacterized protein (DUF488 family)